QQGQHAADRPEDPPQHDAISEHALAISPASAYRGGSGRAYPRGGRGGGPGSVVVAPVMVMASCTSSCRLRSGCRDRSCSTSRSNSRVSARHRLSSTSSSCGNLGLSGSGGEAGVSITGIGGGTGGDEAAGCRSGEGSVGFGGRGNVR